MSKRIISLFLAVAMLFCVSFSAVAYDTADWDSEQEITIVNLSDTISPQELTEIEQSVGAHIVMNDGRTVPIAAVVTVEDMPLADFSTYALSPENSYKVTVQATASEDKIVSDSGEQNYSGINVSATLQLIWTDGPGLDNVIKKVSGTRTVLKGSVDYATVQWGDGWRTAVTWTTKDVTNMSSFSYSPNKTVSCPKAQYSIMMVNAPISSLLLTVSSSVWQ